MKNSGRGGRIPLLAQLSLRFRAGPAPKKKHSKFFPAFPRIMWECRTCPTPAEGMWKIGNLPHVALGRISLPFSKLKLERALRAFFMEKLEFPWGGDESHEIQAQNPFRTSGNPTESSEWDDPEHLCRMPDLFLGFSHFPNPFPAALPHP